MNTSDILTVEDYRVVVALLNEEFDAHNFITVYSSLYAAKYLALLRICKGDFALVNSRIAIFLRNSANTLEIERVTDGNGDNTVIESENIKTNSSNNSCWKKRQ